MEKCLYASSQEAIDFIVQKNNQASFVELLLASLKKAKTIGKSTLNSDLFNALEWPTDFDGYINYLITFSIWTPQQSNLPAWKSPETGQSQEVYDRLCHFYFLIDQEVGENNTIVQNIDWFSNWLIGYAKVWGSYLNTTESFNEEILNTFIKYSPEYRVGDSMINGKPNNPSGWLTFNQFFARELNPGLRPISNPMDNSTITMPADCTYRNKFAIDQNSAIQEITIKKTHSFANIKDLLKGSQYADAFANGTFVHYFLGPYSYHRFHTPVSGILKECYPVHGQVYLDVNASDGQFHAPDYATDGYEFSQARGIVTIDTTNSPYGDMGIVAVIPVGMCQVSSVNMTAQAGHELLKGDEFGYFLFGGSDIILLFQEGKAPTIDTCSKYRYYGTSISDCPNNPK